MNKAKQQNFPVWEYNLTPEEFEKILAGKKRLGWFNRPWAYARVLENLNYYQAKKIIDLNYLKENWNKIKQKLFKQDIKEGYEYLLQKKALSASR